MTVVVNVGTVSLARGEFSVSSVDGAGVPLDLVFYGGWPEALAERNRRCERWADADGVTRVDGRSMPVPLSRRLRKGEYGR